MSERFPGGFITKTPVSPSGPYGTNTASGIWTLDQAMQAQKAGNWPVVGGPYDPQFNYVTMLLHGDGTNGGQNNTFLDSSTNNFTITRNGNTTQGSFSPYGSNWSGYFLNSNGYRLVIDDTNGGVYRNACSGTNYTIEFWVFRISRNSGFYQCMHSAGGDTNNFIIDTSDNLLVTSNGGTSMFTVAANTYVPLNTWTHVALSCSGTTWTLYFNGVSYGTYSSASKTYGGGGSGGAQTGGRNDMNGCGYISNFRISTVARYSSAFTPPTSPFTSDANTALLLCGFNRFYDGSSNNVTLTTINGSVQRFSPFAPSTAYSTATIGGSGYFDGSGDYLTAPAGTAFSFGTGAWTVEAWVYVTTLQEILVFDTRSSASTAGVGCRIDANGTLYYSGSANNSLTSNAVVANSWNHVAWSYDGTTLSGYVNGVRGGTATPGFNITQNNGVVGRVGFSASGYMLGYMGDVRVVKGSAVYSGTSFTVPTAPLTAITNTQLLLNYTNGAIYDNAMMNDLETVGSAQISTSVVKYGTGSIKTGSGNYLIATPPTPSLQIPTSSDFTFEYWVYVNSFLSGSYNLAFGMNSKNYSGVASNRIVLNGDTDPESSFATTINTGTWYHVAFSRSSGTLRAFVNGTQVGSSVSETKSYFTQQNYLVIGAMNGNSFPLDGYIDDLRITKGYARYTANFTAPTQAFPNQ